MTTYTNYDTYIMRDDGACIPVDESNTDYLAYLDWCSSGNVASTPPAPAFADWYKNYSDRADDWVESVARSNQYKDAGYCVGYKTSSVKQFADDAAIFEKWRDAVYVWLATWAAAFNGVLPAVIPTWEEVQAQAPQPEAFGWVIHPLGQVIT